ncbi:hypothetical protein L596_023120 [Steinernema carpocapsae]|uniref:Uncharacterized protein n=1 Tax=Steinernema carpocapsae TaxID=34508 RepID=A0A4U5MCX5_STECR|nr:hypothetical protein L596_023120 [Steinernema carpocapsae]
MDALPYEFTSDVKFLILDEPNLAGSWAFSEKHENDSNSVYRKMFKSQGKSIVQALSSWWLLLIFDSVVVKVFWVR